MSQFFWMNPAWSEVRRIIPVNEEPSSLVYYAMHIRHPLQLYEKGFHGVVQCQEELHGRSDKIVTKA